MIIPKAINGKPFHYDEWLHARLSTMHEDIKKRWIEGRLSVQIQRQLYEQTKLDEIYHSNRIEGNRLTYGETRNIIQADGNIPNRPSIDQVETRNLLAALDYAQAVAFDRSQVVTQNFIRQFHAILMEGVNDDAGRYRDTPNIIKGSRHSTPDAFLVQQMMTDLSDYLSAVTRNGAELPDSPVFAAAAAHALFVQIHPFTDGNGRTARALMNLVLRRNGYPPSIIPEDVRGRYIDALEYTWLDGDLSLLVELLHENIHEGLDTVDLQKSLQTALQMVDVRDSQADYYDWHKKMEYLKVLFEHHVDNLNQSKTSIRGRVARYDDLTIEKYVSLRKGIRVTRTWYFGIELNHLSRRSRYMFFFATPLGRAKDMTPIVVVAAKNTEDGYKNLYSLNRDGINVPDIFQIGYDLNTRKYFSIGNFGIRDRNPQNLVLQFLSQVVERDFGA